MRVQAACPPRIQRHLLQLFIQVVPCLHLADDGDAFRCLVVVVVSEDDLVVSEDDLIVFEDDVVVSEADLLCRLFVSGTVLLLSKCMHPIKVQAPIPVSVHQQLLQSCFHLVPGMHFSLVFSDRRTRICLSPCSEMEFREIACPKIGCR